MWEIAEAMYGKGHGKDNKKIFEANRPMLKSADKSIPGRFCGSPTFETWGSDARALIGSGNFRHVVKAGGDAGASI